MCQIDHHCRKLSDEDWNHFLFQWHARIQHELTNNLFGMLSSCQTKLALKFPETFPSPDILQLYYAPLISESFPNSPTWYVICEPMIFKIAKFCSENFYWGAEKAKRKFTASFWDGVFTATILCVFLTRSIVGVSTDKCWGKSLSLFCAATQLETL